MIQKEIRALFPIEVKVTDFHRELANLMDGLHKLGTILLIQSLPEELHNSLFWGLSIGTVAGVELKTVTRENIKGKLIELPLYLDSNFIGNTVKFELR